MSRTYLQQVFCCYAASRTAAVLLVTNSKRGEEVVLLTVVACAQCEGNHMLWFWQLMMGSYLFLVWMLLWPFLCLVLIMALAFHLSDHYSVLCWCICACLAHFYPVTHLTFQLRQAEKTKAAFTSFFTKPKAVSSSKVGDTSFVLCGTLH